MKPTSGVDIWVPIPKFPCYEACSDGCIRRALDATSRGARGGKILRHRFNSKGCSQVVLYGVTNAKGRLNVTRANIICCTFHGPPPSSKHVAKLINGDQSDCRASNLKWVHNGSWLKGHELTGVDGDS